MLKGYERTEFEAFGKTRPVYRKGKGPGIVVVHEIPGITAEVARFADRLVDEGFEVALPSLFGKVGEPFSYKDVACEIPRVCISREFAILAGRGSSPITNWLRELARDLHERTGGPVGALGMCLTGNFALALAVDPWLMAPVLSQPSLPVGVSSELGKSFHCSDGDLLTLKRRVRQEGLRVLGLRFTHDPLCRASRFRALAEALGEGFEGIEIDSSIGNPHGIPLRAHSVLTNDLVDREGHPTKAALDRVLAFFHERLDRADTAQDARAS